MRPYFKYSMQFELSEELSEKVRELSRVDWYSTMWAIYEIVFNWTIILACMFACAKSGYNIFLVFLSIFVIGARQHALLILMHEASHFNLSPNKKLNNFLSDFFAAWPAIITTAAYRKDHLEHHREVNDPIKDPNLKEKVGLEDWTFPKSNKDLALIFAKDLMGNGMFRILKAQAKYFGNSKGTRSKKSKKKLESKSAWISRIIFYAVAIPTITYFQVWVPVLLLWFLPFLTVLPALLRLRILSEHHGLPGEHDLNQSRNYVGNMIERFFCSPHNVCYHLDHHLFANVPWYKLPKLHEVLHQNEVFGQNAFEVVGIFPKKGQPTVFAQLMGK